MASATGIIDVARGFGNLSGRNKISTIVGLALAITIGVGAWMWGSTPEYRVLYSNVSDRDGGAIVAALGQINVPYRMSDGGGAILVPARQVHEARLRLASQGLPRGGVVGFELMENQKLGSTQFQEQVNYQRALEGELARSIQTLSAVAGARVHLAIPKQSVFLREQQKPSASVIVNLHAGRMLDRAQVTGIAHLVASSVPELALKSVSVLDQQGTLLSSGQQAGGGLDPDQLSYVSGIEAATIKRVSDILEPIVGRSNLRVQVTAEVDFSRAESTAESYKPNQTPDNAVVRSEQKSESSEGLASQNAQGVPGAASNQPRAPGAAGAAVGAQPAPGASTRKDATVNYEVDKTVRHVKSPVGAVKRFSAAVVVNHRAAPAKPAAGAAAGAAAKPATQPLTEEEMAQITALAKEAMGFSQARGDSINVVNAPFSKEEREVPPEVPAWKQPENIALAADGGKLVAVALVILYILFGVVRPLLKSVAETPRMGPLTAGELADQLEEDAGPAYAQRLASAKQLAMKDPKRVADVVKTWVSANG